MSGALKKGVLNYFQNLIKTIWFEFINFYLMNRIFNLKKSCSECYFLLQVCFEDMNDTSCPILFGRI